MLTRAEYRAIVRRDKTTTPGLFGPSRWWTVWATPFQQVARFERWEYAVAWASAFARSVQRQRREGE